MPYRVLVSDDLSPEGVQLLRDLGLVAMPLQSVGHDALVDLAEVIDV